jgi:diguanylate cyclase
MRMVWLAVSAVSTGFGIWATHFIAMLAYSPEVPSSYNVVLTALSLVAAIVLTSGGLALSLMPNWRYGPAVGGAVVALAIAAMHYTGMAAFEVQGVILWDTPLVVASVLIGVAFGAAALPVGFYREGEQWKIAGALLLTLAICTHHFTAMGAVSIIPDSATTVSRLALPAGWLAFAVALGSLIVIALALAGIMLDLRRHRAEHEIGLMRDLANAAVEGLLVCDGDVVVSANTSFTLLTGLSQRELVGTKLERCFPDKAACEQLLSGTDQPIETVVHHVDGSKTPVELILRPVDFGGRPHHVIAVRDLQARKEAERHIRFLALHDGLTSLPNRAHFNLRLDQEIAALPEGETLAVLCLDLDGFKEVNDLFGHAAGDKVLQTVSARVAAVLGERQVMARLGGDEFAILAPGLKSVEAAVGLAKTILQALGRNGIMEDAGGVSTSIGIALCPQDAQDRETLLTYADFALYRAKALGRSTFHTFEPEMQAEIRERQILEHDLRYAAVRDELYLAYQPQLDLRTGRYKGFEVLLRWKHPVRGEVSPALFVPIAEETGAIVEIGAWVLRTACRTAATWPQDLSIAVNVSAMQLYNASFAHELHQILLDTGLRPHQLELEITETALIKDVGRALTTVRLLKALGIRIAMDDFGTGYSSLSNLRMFPIDKIKIDSSFIRSVHCNEQAKAIVRAVLSLGRGLGLVVSAEGVEKPEELQFLRDERCDEAQGYLIARPATVDHFRHLTHDGLLFRTKRKPASMRARVA